MWNNLIEERQDKRSKVYGEKGDTGMSPLKGGDSRGKSRMRAAATHRDPLGSMSPYEAKLVSMEMFS